ncbi:hypothetical protein KR009_005683, partial [Drosophila setifemur]
IKRGIMTRRLLWLLSLVVATAPVLALPTDPENVFADDLTSDYAKRVIHAAKAADIRALMNSKMAPCDDFYAYACGNWHRHNPAQLLNNIMTDTFQMVAKGFDRRLQRLLRSPALQTELEKKLQRFYLSCSMVHRNDVMYKLALENVYREFGELPALAGDRWNSTDFSWWRTVARIQHKYGKQIVLGVDIMHDIRNTSINRVYLSAPERKNMQSGSGFLNLLEQVGTSKDLQDYIGLSPKQAEITSVELHYLERELYEGGNSQAETLQEALSLYTMAELEEKYRSFLNFTEFFAIVLGEDNVPESLYVNDDMYLSRALLTMKMTPLANQANYVLWDLLQEYLLDIEDGDLSKWCTGQTKKYFGQLTDHLVYKRYRSLEAEAEVHAVWDQIRGIFRQHLMGDKLDWMANATRRVAIEKLDSMQLHINSYDSENFDELFGTTEIDRLNYVSNVQQLLMAKAQRSVARLKLPARSLEVTEILSYTPAYNIQENNITIPVALLQPRYFWGGQYPEALKYATLGYLLAHEMIHGFDEEGRNYDASGNLAPWWDIKSSYEFRERRKCFQAQYHQYRYGGSMLPESSDQSENIADNGGVRLAYIAYDRWFEQQTEERRQREVMGEGLDLNGRQLFFLGFAQLWCDDVQTLFKSKVVHLDTHAPSMYRVIGSLSNFQEFSWVYNCSQRAPMDPEYKCAIY